MRTPARIFAALFQGGGDIPLLMPVLDRLIARGHAVRIMVGPGVRGSRLPVSADLKRRITSSGAVPVSFREPHLHPLDAAPHRKGIIGAWVPPGFRIVPGEAETALWAQAWAGNVRRTASRADRPCRRGFRFAWGSCSCGGSGGPRSCAHAHRFASAPRWYTATRAGMAARTWTYRCSSRCSRAKLLSNICTAEMLCRP